MRITPIDRIYLIILIISIIFFVFLYYFATPRANTAGILAFTIIFLGGLGYMWYQSHKDLGYFENINKELNKKGFQITGKPIDGMAWQGEYDKRTYKILISRYAAYGGFTMQGKLSSFFYWILSIETENRLGVAPKYAFLDSKEKFVEVGLKDVYEKFADVTPNMRLYDRGTPLIRTPFDIIFEIGSTKVNLIIVKSEITTKDIFKSLDALYETVKKLQI
ncbi:MAG: hypothetical protein AABX38_03450 [Candidatus Micrarchaeota archaeon]